MSDDTFTRRFNGDRHDLEKVGIEIRVLTGSDAADAGEAQLYLLREEDFRLPEAGFTPEELTALSMALAALDGRFAYARPLRLALTAICHGRKGELEGQFGLLPVALAPDEDARKAGKQLARLEDAVARGRTVTFSYPASDPDAPPLERTLDPYSLFFIEGHWYAVGRDHLRDAIRTFRVTRIAGPVRFVTEKSRDFYTPSDYDPAAYRARPPWLLGPVRGRRHHQRRRRPRLVRGEAGAACPGASRRGRHVHPLRGALCGRRRAAVLGGRAWEDAVNSSIRLSCANGCWKVCGRSREAHAGAADAPASLAAQPAAAAPATRRAGAKRAAEAGPAHRRRAPCPGGGPAPLSGGAGAAGSHPLERHRARPGIQPGGDRGRRLPGEHGQLRGRHIRSHGGGRTQGRQGDARRHGRHILAAGPPLPSHGPRPPAGSGPAGRHVHRPRSGVALPRPSQDSGACRRVAGGRHGGPRRSAPPRPGGDRGRQARNPRSAGARTWSTSRRAGWRSPPARWSHTCSSAAKRPGIWRPSVSSPRPSGRSSWSGYVRRGSPVPHTRPDRRWTWLPGGAGRPSSPGRWPPGPPCGSSLAGCGTLKTGASSSSRWRTDAWRRASPTPTRAGWHTTSCASWVRPCSRDPSPRAGPHQGARRRAGRPLRERWNRALGRRCVVRFWLRWLANGVAIFLATLSGGFAAPRALPLLGHVAGGGGRRRPGVPEQLRQTAPPRPEQAPARGRWRRSITILVNAFILQLFVWVGADLTSRGFIGWCSPAAFVTLITGLINSRWGSAGRESSVPDGVRRPAGPTGSEGRRQAAADRPRPVRTERRRLS